MFEKYNLIHFEVTRPLVHGSQARLETSVKVSEETLSPQIQLPSLTASTNRVMPDASYCITGSFDYLLPSIRKDLPGEFQDSQLFLQSLCVMDNASGYYTQREGYDSILFSYTYSGEGRLQYGEKNYSIPPGTGFVIDCRAAHEYRTAAEHWKHIDIHLWGTQAEMLYQCFRRINTVAFSYSAAGMNRLIENLLESYTNQSHLRNLYVGNALSDLLCSALKKSEMDGSSSIPLVYKQLIRYMEMHYLEPLSLNELANYFHISKYHMSREFHKWTGYAPGEYLILLRIQHASILLAQSDLSIEAVAAQSGFSNMSNFIGQLKKRTGMTPSEFRKKAKTYL